MSSDFSKQALRLLKDEVEYSERNRRRIERHKPTPGGCSQSVACVPPVRGQEQLGPRRNVPSRGDQTKVYHNPHSLPDREVRGSALMVQSRSTELMRITELPI